MEKIDCIMIDELSPYIRKVGRQGDFEWKSHYRKIYDNEWMYCIKGKAYYKTENNKYTLQRGSLLRIKPNLEHKFWIDKNQKSEIIWVHYDFKHRTDVYDLENLIKNNNSIYFNDKLPISKFVRQDYKIENRFILPEYMRIKNLNYIEDRFNDILFAFKEHSFTWQMTAKSNLLLIIKEVIEQMTKEESFKSKYNNEELVEHIKEYLLKYYFRKVTRKEISKYLGYNEDYVGKTFKNKYGVSISQYVNKIRITKAKDLLIKTNLSITDIAELIGFADLYYFSKKMKQLTGYSPIEWRRINL